MGRVRVGARRATASPFVVAWVVGGAALSGAARRGVVRGTEKPRGQVSLTFILFARKGPSWFRSRAPHAPWSQ
ncbi:hypothetical protein GCM10009602_19970 [Nocardiopsis tropica]